MVEALVSFFCHFKTIGPPRSIYNTVEIVGCTDGDFIFWHNVPDEESPLASGVLRARAAGSAGSMSEVPKGRGFAPSVCSHSVFSFQETTTFVAVALL